MKRICFVLVLVFSVFYSNANVQRVCDDIILQVGLVDPTETHEPYGKGPVQIPSVSLEGHTLYFATSCDGCTLRLVDEEKETKGA